MTVPLASPPSPVYGVAVHATTPAHEDRLATALRKLVLEDPSLAVSYEASTKQTILSGGGEAHIRVALSRVARAGVEAQTDDVRVDYLETLARTHLNSPSHIPTLSALSTFSYKAGAIEEALVYARRLVELDPTNPQSQSLLEELERSRPQ